MRAAADAADPSVLALPIGEVIQVFSLYAEVAFEGSTRLCTVRKTLNKTVDGGVIVGDLVRFRDEPALNDDKKFEGAIVYVEPRRTVLTRADSFKSIENHPIVANADQMLIVASVLSPRVKWGLVDRMLIAAEAGGLKPIVCLNKTDLAADDPDALAEARAAMAHYATMGIAVVEASVINDTGIDDVRNILKDKVTVLAGHSGVGKSSLIRAVQASLDLRVGDVSHITDKGRHTTTSARRYPLDIGGAVVDTPGVKVFGLWNVSPENVQNFFPDVKDRSAPEWRVDSMARIEESLQSSGRKVSPS